MSNNHRASAMPEHNRWFDNRSLVVNGQLLDEDFDHIEDPVIEHDIETYRTTHTMERFDAWH